MVSTPFDVTLQPPTQPTAPATPPPTPRPPEAQASAAPRAKRKMGLLKISLVALLLFALLAGGIFVWRLINPSDTVRSEQSEDAATAFDTLSLPLKELNQAGQISLSTRTLNINGQLKVSNSFVLAPTSRPSVGVAGQMYYDQGTNQLNYFNGTDFVTLASNPQTVTSIGGVSGELTLGGGLSLSGNQLNASGILSISSASNNLTVTDDGSGNITLNSTTLGNVQAQGGTPGRIVVFNGTQSIADSIMSQSGTTVSVDGSILVAGTLDLQSAGTSEINITDTSSGVTGQIYNDGNLHIHGGQNNLWLDAGGVGTIFMNAANGNKVAIGQATIPTYLLEVNGDINISDSAAALRIGGTVICTIAGCSGGGGGSVTSLNGLTGALTVANASAAGSTITLNDASTSQKGIVQFNSTNFTVTSGTANTIQNIHTGATPTFAGINTNSITPSAALTVGATSQNLTLQGASTTLSATSGANTAALTFVAPTANVTYRLQTAAAGTYDVCTTAGNCVGVGGGVTTPGGTTNALAKFTGAQTLGDSIISDNGTVVTVSGGLSVTGTVTLTTPLSVANGGTGATTASGARTSLGAASSGANSDITSLSGLTTPLSVVQGGTGATSLTANGVLLGNGTSPVSSLAAGGSGLCLVSTAGAPVWQSCPGSGGVTSVNSQTGAVTIANASASSGTVTINDASTAQKGIAQFNSTNFTASSGTINTIQNINTTATPTFSGVNTNTITPSGALTIGATAQQFTLQGDATSVINAVDGVNSTTLAFQTPTADVTYRFATAAAGTYDVCTMVGNCAGVGGGVTTAGGTTNRIAKFTGSQSIGDSLLSESGSTVTVNGNLNVVTGSQYQINGTQITSAVLSNDSNLAKLNASQTFTGDTVAFRNGTNSATAFSIQNAASNRVLTVDTSGGEVELGQASTLGGRLVFNNATNANTITIVSSTATANRTLTLPDESGTVCLSTGNCAGAGVTLQSAYNNSTSPEITLDATRGALTIIDNATPLGANLLEVQNNAASTTYFAVSATGTSTTGSATVTGNINSSGGALQTNGTTRIDNSGDASNIGTISLSGSISGGTTYSGSGDINTTGGAIQTNSTTRIDNTGNLLNIGNLTAAGALTITSSAAGNIVLNSAGTIELQDNTNLTGNLDVSGTLTAGTGNAFQVAAGGDLTSAGSGTLQGGSLTLGTTSQAGSVVLSDGSNHTGTLQVASLGQNTVYTLPDPGAGTATICLTTGNCAGTGGGITGTGTTNRVSKFTGAGTIGDSSISDDGTTVSTTVDVVVQGGDLTIGGTSQLASLLLHDGNGQTTTLQAGNSAGDLTFILPTTTGSANQCLKQSGTGNQLVWQDCDGGGGGSSGTLQTAYNNGNSITTSDGRDIDIVLANTTTDSNFDLVVADGSTSFVSFTRADGSGTADPAQMLLVDNLDTSRALPIGIKLQAAGGGMTTAIDATDAEIVDAVSVGTNNIVGTTGNIDFSNFDVVGSTGSITTAGDLAVNGGDITSTAGIAVATTNATFAVNTGTGNIDLGTGAQARTINVGTGAGVVQTINVGGTGANVIAIGNTQTGGSVSIGTAMTTGNVAIGGGLISIGSTNQGRTINLGTGAAQQLITIGSTNSTSLTSIQAGAGGVNIATANASIPVQIGNIANAVSQTISIGNNATASSSTTVTIGSLIGSSPTTIQGGTGHVTLSTTHGNRIQIGSATTDATAMLFTLDSYNTTDPTGTNGAMYYSTSTNTFRCHQNSTWVDCITTAGTVTLQDAYDDGNTITTTDNRNIAFTLTDQSTDPSFLIDLQCDTSCSTNGRFAVQDDGTDVFTISPAGGKATFRNSTNTTQGLDVENSAGNNVFTVDTSNSRVGINLGSSNVPTLNGSGLEIQGGLRLSGGGSGSLTDQYSTPLLTGINAKINIPNYDPGDGSNAIIAAGMPTTASSTTSTVISVFDPRTNSSHWPSIAVWSPNESHLAGISWAGSDSTARFTTQNRSGATAGVILQSGDSSGSASGNVAVDAGSAGGTAGIVNLGATNASTVNLGRSNSTNTTNILGGTGGINLSTNNASSFITAKSSTNNTTAFRVLNASDVPQFVVDTSNSRVYIGDPTADSTGALLVLDTKDSTGDPTDVTGAMYYNSAYGRMRCNFDGKWRYCNDPQSMSLGYNITDEFVTGVSGSIGQLGWVIDNTGAGATTSSQPGVASRNGILRLETGTATTVANTSIYLNADGEELAPLTGGEEIEFAINLATLADGTNDYNVRAGLCDVSDGNDCDDGVYIEYDRDSSTNWRIATANTGSRTKTNSSTAVTTGWHRFKMVVNSGATSIEFFLDGTSLGSISTNIPTATSQPQFNIVKDNPTGSANRTLDVDYFQWRNSFTTAR